MLIQNKLCLGDCVEVMRSLDADCVDLVVTDPPYGYSFMGKDWDRAVPSVEVWRECLRVLKHGAFAFVMSSPRADVLSHMIVNLSDAGFRTDFTPIYWCYASGFPKAMNVSKMVDKRLGVEREILGYEDSPSQNIKNANMHIVDKPIEWVNLPITKATSPEARLLDGSFGGFQPKPAVEVILVAMKPLSEKTFVDQALRNGKGVTWLDDTRIPYLSEDDIGDINRFEGNQQRMTGKNGHNCYEPIEKNVTISQVNVEGRFPANLLVSDDCLNDGTNHVSGHMDSIAAAKQETQNCYGKMYQRQVFNQGDEGSFSRYFSLDAWFTKQFKKLPVNVQRTFPFLIEPKASKSERNTNLERLDNGTYLDESRHDKTAIGCNNPRNRTGKLRVGNIHPTVKPLQLMSYLITLGSRSGDLVLDPFVGSGTSCLAAKMLGRNYVGVELVKDYFEIACARVDNHKTLFEFSSVNPLDIKP